MNASEEEEDSDLSYILADMLIQMSIQERICIYNSCHDSKTCPLCSENRQHKDCRCDLFMGYGFALVENTKQLGTLSKCTQRGGTTRLLSTDPAKQKQLIERQIATEQSMLNTTDGDFGNLATALGAIPPQLGKEISKVSNASRVTYANQGQKGIISDPNAKADFGILMITPTEFWFFTENPGRWEETPDGNS